MKPKKPGVRGPVAPRASGARRSVEPRASGARLPVEPARLKEQFPDLTDEELDAYGRVTAGLMESANRTALLRETLEKGRKGQARRDRGEKLGEADRAAALYLDALAKMQAPVAPAKGRPKAH